MMARYRKIAEVDAVQYLGQEIPGVDVEELSEGFEASIQTLEGRLIVNMTDWVLTGIDGEKWPVRHDIFTRSYTLVEP